MESHERRRQICWKNDPLPDGEAGAAARELLARHDAANPFPEDVLLTADADYMGDGRPCHRMDIFRPREAKEALPVLVNIHGGGFLLGKKEVNRLFCADMCRRGFVVFCLEYPLVPDVDIFTVFRALTAGIERAAALARTLAGTLPSSSSAATARARISACISRQCAKRRHGACRRRAAAFLGHRGAGTHLRHVYGAYF